MKNLEIVCSGNRKLGYFSQGKYLPYSEDEKQQLFTKLEREIIKKDARRRITSFIVGIILGCILFILLIFNLTSLLNIDWFTFTFIILGAIALWVLFYYLIGLFAYRQIFILWHLQNKTGKNPNHCVNYANSDYGKWVDNYVKYVGFTDFITDSRQGKKEFVNLCLYRPKSLKNFIFNGYLISNIYYYYLSFSDKKIFFMPGFIVYLDKKDTQVFPYEEFSYTLSAQNYCQLKRKDQILLEFSYKPSFNMNFFNFKY